MVIRELVSEISKRLNENAVFEAQQIVMSAAGINNTEFVLNQRTVLSEKTVKAAREMTQRRINGEPLQYIVGTAGFMGLEFKVNKNVLIPRADTETLVEEVLNLMGGKNADVLDIGTGSGCIGISIAHFNRNAEVTFLDVSEDALNMVQENAVLNGVKGEFMRMDILTEYPAKKFDLIVSNPPYIRPEVIASLQTEVKDYEPYSALCGGSDGLDFYRRITSIAPKILKQNGILAFEIGYDQGAEVLNMMTDFKDVRLIKDLCGNDRVVIGTLDTL